VKKFLTLFGVLLVLVSVQGQQAPMFHSGANVVVVPVVVKDAAGRFVFGLSPRDFQVFDNGKMRDVTQLDTERVPVSLGILLDVSGSMSSDDTRRAFELLVTRLHPEDEVFLSAFRETVIAAVPWTRDHRRIVDGFNQLRTGGNTELYKAVSTAVPMFDSTKNRRKVLVIISDGLDSTFPAPTPATIESPARSASPQEESRARAAGVRAQENDPDLPRLKLLAAIREAVDRTQVVVYAVGIGTRQRVDVSTLRGFTDGNGGYTEAVRKPSDIPDVIAGICDDLQAQYVLGFEAPAPDLKVHRISLKVKQRGLRVRARQAYFAAER
jgi:VWFA-related protein